MDGIMTESGYSCDSSIGILKRSSTIEEAESMGNILILKI